MSDAVIKKLQRVAAIPIVTEEQAVYFLVQTRKLLDLRNYPKDQWRPIRFICDWTVHTELDRKTGWANDLLTFADRIMADNRNWDALSASEVAFLQENFGLHSVRNAMMDVLRINGIPPITLGHPIGWYSFMMQFSSAVSGSSLRLKGGGFIDEVTVEMVKGNDSGTKLDLEWTFTKTDKSTPFQLVLPTVVVLDEGHFGRGGKASDERFEGLLRDAGLRVRPIED